MRQEKAEGQFQHQVWEGVRQVEAKITSSRHYYRAGVRACW